jgi:hypothetical protein
MLRACPHYLLACLEHACTFWLHAHATLSSSFFLSRLSLKREREREGEKGRDRQTDRQKEREKERDREGEKGRERKRERERERHVKYGN